MYFRKECKNGLNGKNASQLQRGKAKKIIPEIVAQFPFKRGQNSFKILKIDGVRLL